MPPSESNPRFRPWSKLLFFVLAKLVFNAILVATVLIILVEGLNGVVAFTVNG